MATWDIQINNNYGAVQLRIGLCPQINHNLNSFLASSTSHSSTRNLVTESLQTTVVLLQLPLKCFPLTVDSSWRFSGIKFTEI